MKAYQKLIRREKNRIFSYAYYLIHNREDAEDIVQEVLIKLWQHWNEVDPQKRMGWIMRVTHNTCIDWARRKRSISSRSKMTSSVNPDQLPADRMPAPDEAVILSEQHQALLEAMKILDNKVREMLLLHYFNGMKYEEIGEIYNTSEGNVKVTVHRGRKKLMKVMMEQHSEMREP